MPGQVHDSHCLLAVFVEPSYHYTVFERHDLLLRAFEGVLSHHARGRVGCKAVGGRNNEMVERVNTAATSFTPFLLLEEGGRDGGAGVTGEGVATDLEGCGCEDYKDGGILMMMQ